MKTHNSLLTEIAEELLFNGFTLQDVANFGKDLPGEAEAILERQAEAAWESWCDRSGGDDRAALRDAGRGHLVKS